MTRQQKIILAILAFLNIAVIGTLSAYAVITTRRARPLQQAHVPDPCTAAILSALSDPDSAAFVDWSQAAAHVDVSLPAPAATDPPAQLIWALLDRLPAELEYLCATPTTVTLAVHSGNPRRQTQTAVFPGPALMDWLNCGLSDDELAAQAEYRLASAAPAPQHRLRTR
ncbi:MAG: hypothetical protein MUQ10_06345 [Anaerolineae bacterium]|nr:hypothetical protein [Anaerolineae bacterium]